MKHRQRGVGLIEAVLFVTIAIGSIVGGIVFFAQASESSRVNEAVRSIVALQSGVRSVYQSSSSFGEDGVDLLPATLASGAAPRSRMTPEGGLLNEWGGTVSVSGYRDGFVLAYGDIPTSACMRLAPHSAQGAGTAGAGIAAVTINGVLVDADGDGSVSSEEAAAACAMPAEPMTLHWAFASDANVRIAAADYERMLGVGDEPGEDLPGEDNPGGNPEPDPEPAIETGRTTETETAACASPLLGTRTRTRDVISYNDGSSVPGAWSEWNEQCGQPSDTRITYMGHVRWAGQCGSGTNVTIFEQEVRVLFDGTVIKGEALGAYNNCNRNGYVYDYAFRDCPHTAYGQQRASAVYNRHLVSITSQWEDLTCQD